MAPRVVPAVHGESTVTPSGEYGGSGLQIVAVKTIFDGVSDTSRNWCTFTGTFTFNGGKHDPVGATNTGMATITLRCSPPPFGGGTGPAGVVTQMGSFTYTIGPGTNEFTVTISGDPNGSGHGTTFNDGETVLLDGTTRNNTFTCVVPTPPGCTATSATYLLSLIDYATLVKPK
jgi:hypothetical protein